MALLFVLVLLAAANIVRAFSAKGIDYVGRFREIDGRQRAEWPGAGLRLTYSSVESSKANTLNVTFSDCGSCNYFVSVYHNCEQKEKFNIRSGQFGFQYSLPATDRLHNELSIIKVTETNQGDASGFMEIVDLDLSNARVSPVFQPTCTTGKKLLFIGDSYTCAYGVDDTDPCSFSASTEDVTHGYAYDLGRTFKADVQTIAWSGKGVVRNYADPNQVSETPMPAYYNRTLATISVNDDSANYWDPKRYVPDVITVLLGTNDYSTHPEPSDEQFTTGLINFANQLRKDYPTAKRLLACSPALTALQCNNVANAADATDSTYVQIPPSVFTGGYGCAGHPSVLTQQYMAEAIQPVMEELLQ